MLKLLILQKLKLIYINIEDNDNLPPEYDVYLIDFYSHDQYQTSLSYLANKCGTDKLTHNYIPYYEKIFYNIKRYKIASEGYIQEGIILNYFFSQTLQNAFFTL